MHSADLDPEDRALGKIPHQVQPPHKPKVACLKVCDTEPNAGKDCINGRNDTGIRIARMNCTEEDRGDRDRKPCESRACERLQDVAAEQSLFKRRCRCKDQKRREQR